MKYSIEKSFGVCVAGAVGALVTLAAACSSGSGATVVVPLNCGAGTTQVGSACVADQADATTMTADASGTPDSGSSDASAPGADALPSEGGDAGADAAPLVADPCPSGTIDVNCDDTCDAGSLVLDAGNLSACYYVSCRNFSGPDDPLIQTFSMPATFRTPEMPTQYPLCSGGACGLTAGTEAPVYAMIFRIAQPAPGDSIQVQVGAPWYIDAFDDREVPICVYVTPEADRAQGCLSLPITHTSSTGAVFVVWTNDNSAVAREIDVTEVSTSTACQ